MDAEKSDYQKDFEESIKDKLDKRHYQMEAIMANKKLMNNKFKAGADYDENVYTAEEVELDTTKFFAVSESDIIEVKNAIGCMSLYNATQKGSSSYMILQSEKNRAISASDLDLGENISFGQRPDIVRALLYDGVIKAVNKIRNNPNMIFKEIKLGTHPDLKKITVTTPDSEIPNLHG